MDSKDVLKGLQRTKKKNECDVESQKRQIRVDIETTWAGVSETEFFEVDRNTTEKEIEEIASDIFSSYCSYGWSEVTYND